MYSKQKEVENISDKIGKICFLEKQLLCRKMENLFFKILLFLDVKLSILIETNFKSADFRKRF